MKKSHRPTTRVKNPEPSLDSPDWVIWAAWADRITFEEIEKKTGKTEGEVIKIMRRSLKPQSFRLWRKRASSKSIKHRKKFEYSRKQIKSKINKNKIICKKRKNSRGSIWVIVLKNRELKMAR